MAKKLKTGDVKRLDTQRSWVSESCKWVILNFNGDFWSCYTRESARSGRLKGHGERIARILSIGPKYVTVRISK